MSIQDDLFDIEAMMQKQPADIKDAWERVYTNFFLIEQERDAMRGKLEHLQSAYEIIKKTIGAGFIAVNLNTEEFQKE